MTIPTKFQTDELINDYAKHLKHYMGISKNLQTQIDDATTTLKKGYYHKKLVKNNKKCAKIILRLNRWMEMRGDGIKVTADGEKK